VTLLYADTSAILRAYFADERDHEELRAMLLEAEDPVVTSEMARVEIASAVRAAGAGGRLPRWRRLLARIDADCGQDGPITLLALRPRIVLPRAYDLVVETGLRTLDALHLAVAIEECPALAAGSGIVFVTRHRDQAAAATALGLAVS